MKIGLFLQDTDSCFHGRIFGLGIGSISVIFEPKETREGLAYYKLIAAPTMDAYEIGVAFEKQKEGLIYYSVSLDSPLFPAPIHAALFPDRELQCTFNLIWDRADLFKMSADNKLSIEQQQNRRFIGANVTP